MSENTVSPFETATDEAPAEEVQPVVAVPSVETLNAFDLRDAADVLNEYAPVAAPLLGTVGTYFTLTANQLNQLAALKDADDEKKAKALAEYLAAEQAYKAKVELLTQAIADALKTSGISRATTRRTQAEALLAQFDISPKV